MRKRRVILYDDDPAILSLLTLLFEERSYEVVGFPEAEVCPVYEAGGSCDMLRPCGDLMISDLEMPRMSGIELFQLQKRQGCKLNIRNKAILSGNLGPEAVEAIRNLGCQAFAKPFRFSTLAAWVDECELRMDLSLPLGVRRRQRRDSFFSGAVFKVEREADLFSAEVVNRSDSGLCVRLDRPLAVAEVLSLQTHLPLPSDRLLVRWLRPQIGGGYLAGMSCC